MATDLCTLSELPPSMCAHCKGHRGLDEEIADMRRALQTRGWIIAQQRGVCVACGEEFERGVAIRHWGRGYRAECCSEAAGG